MKCILTQRHRKSHSDRHVLDRYIFAHNVVLILSVHLTVIAVCYDEIGHCRKDILKYLNLMQSGSEYMTFVDQYVCDWFFIVTADCEYFLERDTFHWDCHMIYINISIEKSDENKKLLYFFFCKFYCKWKSFYTCNLLSLTIENLKFPLIQ